jgi:hypothetical protein
MVQRSMQLKSGNAADFNRNFCFRNLIVRMYE